MFFNQYPYLNLNDLNLDYILKAIGEMKYEVTNFVSINAIKYADPIQWSITSQYEKNTIVIDPVTGTAYISVAPVPAGVALTRPEYWTVVFDLGSFVTRAAQNFTSRWESETTATATFPSNTGEWLVWGDVLYKALTNITAGDTYVVNGNIEHFTIEDLYNAYLNTIAQILALVGNLVDLNTSDTSSIVNAINSVLSDLTTKIENLHFDTVVEMLGADLQDGDACITMGDTALNDNKNALYRIKNTIPEARHKILSNGNYAELIEKTINPDDFEGATDADKLQAAIDYALSYDTVNIKNLYPTILIDRPYDITGATLKINKGEYLSDSNFYRYRSKLTFIGTADSEIYKADSGFIFSADSGTNGGIAFINMHFRGGVVQTASMTEAQIIAARKLGCSVFDTSKLRRFNTFNCSYTLLGVVFDGTLANDAATNAQSITSMCDMANYCDAFWTFSYSWDCTIAFGIIENCTCGIRDVDDNNNATVRKFTISKTLIEGCYDSAISLLQNSHPNLTIANIVIDDCYIEECGNHAIAILPHYLYLAKVTDSYIVMNSANSSQYDCIKIRSEGDQPIIHDNYLSTAAYGVEVTNANNVFDMVNNRYYQVGGVGTFTNSVKAYTKFAMMRCLYKDITTPTIAGNTSFTVTLTDFGDITNVAAIIPMGIGHGSTYNTFPIVVGITNSTITLHTIGTDSQTYAIRYAVIGY